MISLPEPVVTRPGNPSSLPKAIAIVGLSNSGKTGLICRLLPWLAGRGLRVAVLKHSHKAGMDLGEEGKDTWRYRQAGAQTVALSAPGVLQVTRNFPGEPPLEQVLALLAPEADLVLVEGYKTGPLPKVAVLGPGSGGQAPDYPHLIALVSGHPVSSRLPVFRPDQIEELGRCLYDYVTRD